MEIKKEMTLTLDEAKKLKKISGIDSVVRRINKIKTANEDFFLTEYLIIGTKIILAL